MDKKDFAAFVGIDWGDQQHAVCVAANGQRFATVLEHAVDEIDTWASELRQRYGSRPIALCLEQSRGALVYALLKYDFLVLFPVNPKQLASYRDAFVPCGPKDDPTDAELLCQFVEQNHQRLRAWKPDDESTRTLRQLAEDRRHWVNQRTALKNRLRQRLKEYFPLALQLASSNLSADWFLRLLKKFPTQQQLRRANPRTLLKLLPKRSRVADDEHEDTRITLIRSLQPLVTDRAVIATHRLDVLQLVTLILQLNTTVDEYDREIEKSMEQHCDATLFQSFPAAGPTLAPRLAAAFGTDRERFQSAVELQQLSGIAPVLKRSGKSCQVQRRIARPRFLHQTFYEYADHSRKKSAWANAYYKMLKARGMRHHSALRSLAYKWQRIMFRCWKTRTPYDECKYVQQLQQRQSPLLEHLPPAITT
jgi:transposase